MPLSVGSFVNTDKEEMDEPSIKQKVSLKPNLEWMPGAKRMYQFIEKYDPYILSAAFLVVTPHLKLVNLNGCQEYKLS